MNAPLPAPFPINPGQGQRYGAWVWNGQRWVCTQTQGNFQVVQVFKAAAPYTPSPGMTSATIECWGAGGGGGGASNGPEITWLIGGGGAGSGGYSRLTLQAAMVAGGVNVTIGVGGVGGGAAELPGTAGTATSFGTLCVANGGFGGANNGFGDGSGQSALGAVPGTGDIAFPGAGGTPGVLLVVPPEGETVTGVGGLGGAVFGGNGVFAVGPGSGLNGYPGGANTGAGGSGGTINQAAPTTVAGGGGGSGLCVVTETCWSDATDNGCGCEPVARVADCGWPE